MPYRKRLSLEAHPLAAASDPEALEKKLKKGWKAQNAVNAVQARVDSYARQHHISVRQLKHPVSVEGGLDDSDTANLSEQQRILNKVISDGEMAGKMTAAESVAYAVMKSGIREYIDDACEEVGALVEKKFAGKSEFSWRHQGHHSDNPGGRQSSIVNGIDDCADASLIEASEPCAALCTGDRPASAMELDFVKDFSGSPTRKQNAASTQMARSGVAAHAWASRTSLPGFGIRRHDDGIIDVPIGVPENPYRCRLGCFRCDQQVHIDLVQREQERQPYDDWRRTLRTYCKAVWDQKHAPLKKSASTPDATRPALRTSDVTLPALRRANRRSSVSKVDLWREELDRFGRI